MGRNEKEMIPINELRIGNLTMLKGVVYPIAKPENMNGSEWLDPIPITPEWLERFGFEKKESDWGFVAGSYFTKDEIEFAYFDPILKLKRYKSANLDANICLHIHQLQNLYHALTATELTYTV